MRCLNLNMFGYSLSDTVNVLKFHAPNYDKKAYANRTDPDQTAQGLHCLPFH